MIGEIVGQGGGGSPIKSVQRGVYILSDYTGDVTISSIDTSKSVVKLSIKKTDSGDHLGATGYYIARGDIIDSTTIRFTKGYHTSWANLTIAWEVIEFDNVKSVQSGTTVISAYPQTVSINAIDTSKSVMFCSRSSASSSDGAGKMEWLYRIVDSTSIELSAPTADMTMTWYVVEYN